MPNKETYSIKEMIAEFRKDTKESFDKITIRQERFNDLQTKANHRTTKLEEWSLSAQDKIESNSNASSINTFSRARFLGGLAVLLFLFASLGVLIRYSVRSSIDDWVEEANAVIFEKRDDEISGLISKSFDELITQSSDNIVEKVIEILETRPFDPVIE